MATVRPFNRTFREGLQTTRSSGDQEAFGGFGTFHNLRTGTDEVEMRPGRVRLATIAGGNNAADGDGAKSATAKLDTGVWDLNRSRWALEAILKLTSASTATILQVGSTTVACELGFDSGPDWTFTWYDAGGSTTLTGTTPVSTALTHLAVEKDGTAIRLLVNGVEEDSDTWVTAKVPAGALTLLGKSGSEELDGAVQELRLRALVPPHYRHRLRPLLNPRAEHVLACYRGAVDANGVWLDHSRHELHGVGTLVAGAVAGRAFNPVRLLESYVTKDGRRRLIAVAGDTEYEGDV